MSIERQPCWIAICDSCGPSCWDGVEAELPTFLTPQLARLELVAMYEWRVTRQLDGRWHLLCAGCSAKVDCDAYGHAWKEAELEPGTDVLPAPIILCPRCGTVQHDKPAEPLTAEEAAWLAAVDAQLFPEQAI